MITWKEISKFAGYAAALFTHIGVLISAFYNNGTLSAAQININLLINGVGFIAVYLPLVGVKLQTSGAEGYVNAVGFLMYTIYFAGSCVSLRAPSIYMITGAQVIVHVIILTFSIPTLATREILVALSNFVSTASPLLAFLVVQRWKLSRFEVVLSLCNLVTTLTEDKTYSLKLLRNLKAPQTTLASVYVVVCVVEVLDLKFRAKLCGSVKKLLKSGNKKFINGEYSEALEDFSKAALSNPTNSSLRLRCVETKIELGHLREAFEECEEVTRRDPLNGAAFSILTGVSLRFGRPDLAGKYARFANPASLKVLRDQISVLERHFDGFEIARRCRDWDYATREIQACLSMGIQSAFVWTFKAEILLNKLNLDEAEKTLDKADQTEAPIFPMDQSLKYFGMFLDSYLLIIKGRVDMAFGRFGTALEFYTRAAAFDPTCTELCAVRDRFDSIRRSHRKGKTFLHKGMLKEAAASFADGLQYDPCNVLLCDATSDCYERMGQWEKCAIFCDRALLISPSYTHAKIRRAHCSAKMGNVAQSIPDCEAVMKEGKGNGQTEKVLSDTKKAYNLQLGVRHGM